jgi:hypothetical protein
LTSVASLVRQAPASPQHANLIAAG